MDNPGPKVPILIGIYGVSGCGKSTILTKLAPWDGHTCYDGSDVIATITVGGLEQFKRFDASEQGRVRGEAITWIKEQAIELGCPAIVAGHFSFWNRDQGRIEEVITAADLKSYTHIIYLNPDADTVVEQCQNDHTRQRENLTVEEVRQWQTAELQQLRKVTQEHTILLAVVRPVRPGGDIMDSIRELLRDFTLHNVDHNRARAEAALDNALDAKTGRHTLVLDADKTIAPQDTGALYWSRMTHMYPNSLPEGGVSEIFSGPLAYTYGAFRQAMLRYEETARFVDFDYLCREISKSIQPYEQILNLLHSSHSKGVSIVVITSGLKHVWEMVLKRLGLSDNIKVIGGCRLQDGYVVTPELKGQLVARLKDQHGQKVAVIGDSPVDIEMLKQADVPAIVAGDESSRSRSMPSVVADAIANGELKGARQVLLPVTTTPLLGSSVLPIATLTEVAADLMVHVTESQGVSPQDVLPQEHTWVHHLTDTGAAKFLASSMRDPDHSGQGLCVVHRAVGEYLAMNLLTEVIGLQDYEMPHVQSGKTTRGYSLKDERKTTIVALMRGGEPMAYGVYGVFSRAMFKHVNQPDQLAHHHVGGQRTIILVDSVINSGQSIVDMVDRVRQLCREVRIVIVAGVVQKDCLSADGLLALMHAREPSTTLVALRLSENKFKGSGATDTGNRLFNTTHID